MDRRCLVEDLVAVLTVLSWFYSEHLADDSEGTIRVVESPYVAHVEVLVELVVGEVFRLVVTILWLAWSWCWVGRRQLLLWLLWLFVGDLWYLLWSRYSSFFPGATVSGGSYCTEAFGCFDFFCCVWPPGGKTLVPGFVVGGSCFGFFIGGAVVDVGLVVRRRGCSMVGGGGLVAVSVAGGGVWRRAGWLSGGCSAARVWRGHSPAGGAGFCFLLSAPFDITGFFPLSIHVGWLVGSLKVSSTFTC